MWAIIKYLALIGLIYGVFALLWLGCRFIGLVLNLQLVAVLLLTVQVFTAVFGIVGIIESLYFNKDNELLIVFPVSPNEIFYSKLIYIYLRELLVNVAVVFPVLLSFGIATSQPWSYFIILFVLIPILPILPMAVSLLLSIPIALVVAFFKKHQLFGALFILIVVAAFVWGYASVISLINGSFNVASQQVQTMLKVNDFIYKFGGNCLIFTWLAQSLYSLAKFYWVIVYLGAGSALVVAISFLMKPFYFGLVLKANEGIARKKIKVGQYKIRKPFASLFLKEVRTSLRSPNYIFQYFTFTLLMPFIVVSYDRLLLQLVVNSIGQGMVAGSHVLILCTLAMLSNISSSSAISREGSAFVLLKTNPCSFYKITFAKVCFNAAFTIGGIIITGVICCFYQNALEIILGSIGVAFFAIGHICMCIDDDICNPTLNWYDSGEISKLSKNTIKAVISGLVIAFIVGFAMMLGTSLGWISYILLIVVGLLFMVWRVGVLTVRISYRYERTEM